MRWGLGVDATWVCDGGGRHRLQDEEGGGGEAPAAQAEQGLEEEGEGSGPPGEGPQEEEEEETGGHDDVEGEEEGEEEPLLPTEEEMEALAASLEGQFFCEYGPAAGHRADGVSSTMEGLRLTHTRPPACLPVLVPVRRCRGPQRVHWPAGQPV